MKGYQDFSNVVYKLRISGVITGKTLEKVSNELTNKSFFKPVALAVIVNSPGGSAAHSSLIFHRLQSFSKHHKIPILSFAEDIAASGGYYIMCAGQQIYATTNLSLIGSIGALSSFFSIKDLANRYGVERRTWASSNFDINLRFDQFQDVSKDTVQ